MLAAKVFNWFFFGCTDFLVYYSDGASSPECESGEVALPITCTCETEPLLCCCGGPSDSGAWLEYFLLMVKMGS